jgi:hypothetical protein
MDLTTKIGDTADLPRYQLLDGDGDPVDLAGATVVQRFDGAPEGGSPCTVADAATGMVRLASRSHLPEPSAGRSTVTIAFETEVTFSDSTVQTFPTAGYDRWIIWQDLDA